MEKSRQELLFDTALEEFAAGYDHANTNRICEKAGVSKGLLFHYYGSKKELYEKVIDHCVDDVILSFQSFTVEGLSFVDALLAYSRQKCAFYLSHPYHYTILNDAFLSPPVDVMDSMRKKYYCMESIGRQIMSGLLDKIVLRKGINREVVLSFLVSTSCATDMLFDEGDIRGKELSETIYTKVESRYLEVIDLVLHGIGTEKNELII